MKINMIRFNNAQLPATFRPTVLLTRFPLLARTLLRKSEATGDSARGHCAASQQFNVFNSEWQAPATRRTVASRAMTTSNPFGGILMVRVGKRCLHPYPTYLDLLSCPPSINLLTQQQ